MYLAAIALYSASLLCQIGAAVYSFYLVKVSPTRWRWAWLALALGLSLMIGRRIAPLRHITITASIDIIDAMLSVPISALLLIGVIGVYKIIEEESNNNDLLSTLSQLDSLTGALSRSEILYRVSQEIEQLKRSGEHFALLELDIDHFKNVNDTYGHDAGDLVLFGLVKTIKSTLRINDAIGRIGGEEFLVLLPHTSETHSKEIAERIRELVEKTFYQITGNKTTQITISIGCTMSSLHAIHDLNTQDAINQLVKKTDEAMYQAKNNGRNCCFHAG